MHIYTIWLDSEQAKTFRIDSGEASTASVNVHHHHEHHSHLAKQRDTALMFKQLAQSLRDAEKILLVGPGQAKNQFSHFLGENFSEIAKKVVGCEPFEHSSDAQIEAFGKKFFQSELQNSKLTH